MKYGIEDYNVSFHSPGKSDRSAMPIGNGELAASVWMTEAGKLRFYLARTDALTELDRTVKLGMGEIDVSSLFVQKEKFCQELKLKEGRIEFSIGKNRIYVWVDHGSDTIYVKGILTGNFDICATWFTWRTQENRPKSSPVFSSGLKEQADVVGMEREGILFYHENGENGLAELAKLQGIENIDVVPDMTKGRIFGGLLQMQDSEYEGNALRKKKCSEFLVKITTHSSQAGNVETWKKELKSRIANGPLEDESFQRTEYYWKSFWEKSYIYVEGDRRREPRYTESVLQSVGENTECSDTPSKVTRAYLLTRYMTACCMNGEFPICYHGMLFNLCPGKGVHLNSNFAVGFTGMPQEEYPSLEINPDERSWTIEMLWQNLRLPYYSLLATGDFEAIKRLFRYFRRFWKLNRERAKKYYYAEGQHNTEMTLSCGLLSESIYGMDRKFAPDGYSQNRWGGAIDISPGLELLNLMLEYETYIKDTEFIRMEILPYAKELMMYISTRFRGRENGKIIIYPLNSVETYQNTCDPAPVVAGMQAVLKKMLKLETVSGEDRKFFEEMQRLTPELPSMEAEEGRVILPARRYREERTNVEPPELYAIYPFALMGKFLGQEDCALQTFKRALEIGGQMEPFVVGSTSGSPSYSGWQYVGNVAAMLGLRKMVEEILTYNCSLQNPGYRFPAMWGPIYDAVPDVDHGANIMNLLQLMVMQCTEDKIYLLPAVPDGWDISFRLYAPDCTVVTCEYRNGSLIHVDTVPESRKKDIVVC